MYLFCRNLKDLSYMYFKKIYLVFTCSKSVKVHKTFANQNVWVAWNEVTRNKDVFNFKALLKVSYSTISAKTWPFWTLDPKVVTHACKKPQWLA